MDLLTKYRRAMQVALERDQAKARERAQALEDVYFGRSNETWKLIGAELKRFSQVDINAIPRLRVNVAKRIIDTLSMVYKSAPVRSVDRDPTSDAEVAYQDMLKASSIGLAAPMWNAMAVLHNTILVRPVWNAKDERLEFRTYTRAWTDVQPDPLDYHRAADVRYWVDARDELGGWKKDGECFVWSDREAFKLTKAGPEPMPRIDANGNRTKASDFLNPYGELPFAVLRLEDQGDFWGEGASDIIDGSIAFLAQMAGLLQNGFEQSFSELLMINCGVGKNVKAGSEVGGSGEVQKGAHHATIVENVESGEVPPSMEYVTPSPLLEPLTKVLNNMLQILCWSRGLNAQRAINLMTGTGGDTAPSGVALSLMNADLEEIRGRYLESFRAFERDLYQKIRLVLAKDAGIDLPDVAEFQVDFAELQVKWTPAEIQAKREHEFKFNLSTPADWKHEENPERSLEECQADILANAAYNEQVMTGDVLSDALRQGGGAPGTDGQGDHSPDPAASQR